jgi:hypothetical protein
MFRWQVNLGSALIYQSDVGLYEKVEAGERTALKKPGLGLHGRGDGDPYVALLLGERAPTGGHRAENLADRDLRGAAGIKWDKRLIANLPVPISLPNNIPAFARFGVGHFHNQVNGVASRRPQVWAGCYANCQRQN